MDNLAKQGNAALKTHIKISEGAGLLSLFSTMLIWIQTEEMKAPIFSLHLAITMNVLFVLVPLTFFFRDSKRPVKVQTQGILALVSGFGAIFGFCGATPFFYFIFAEMPFFLRLCGLGLVIISGIIWAILCWRDHVKATEKTDLMRSEAYAEFSNYIVYDGFKAGDILNRHLRTRNPVSLPFMIVFMIVAPFGTFFYRFFGEYLGSQGMMWVIGLLVYPLYLFLIGGIVQVYRKTILIPKILTQQTGKPIYWAG